jgi:hypothetical protein
MNEEWGEKEISFRKIQWPAGEASLSYAATLTSR